MLHPWSQKCFSFCLFVFSTFFSSIGSVQLELCIRRYIHTFVWCKHFYKTPHIRTEVSVKFRFVAIFVIIFAVLQNVYFIARVSWLI